MNAVTKLYKAMLRFPKLTYVHGKICPYIRAFRKQQKLSAFVAVSPFLIKRWDKSRINKVVTAKKAAVLGKGDYNFSWY